MEQAYFTNIRSQIIPRLRDAKRDVVIAMAWFTSKELFEELLSCCHRNVHVDLVLLDNDVNFMYYAPDFNILIKAGGVLRIAHVCDHFMHHKFRRSSGTGPGGSLQGQRNLSPLTLYFCATIIQYSTPLTHSQIIRPVRLRGAQSGVSPNAVYLVF